MDLVAAGIPEIHFAVLDDRVGPICDIQGAVRTDFDVDRPEILAASPDQFRLFLSGVARPLFFDGEPDDPMGPEIVGDGRALPSLGEVVAVNQFQAAVFGIAARADAFQRPGGSGVGEVHRAGHAVVDAMGTGSVGEERLAVAIEIVSPRIAEPAQEDFQFQGLGAQVPDAGAVEPSHPVRGLDMAMDVNRLIHVQLAVVSPAEGMQHVMSVFGAESRQHDFAAIGLAVAVGIGEVQQQGVLRDVDAPVAR